MPAGAVKIRTLTIPDTFLTAGTESLLLVFCILDVFYKTFTQRVDLIRYIFIARGCKCTLCQTTDAVNIETLHFVHRHIFGPQIDAKCILMFMIPKSHTHGFGFRKPWIRLISSIPQDFIRHIIMIQLDREIYG